MDPVSAAGIGLSIVSLTLQVFAGCITAYQIFTEVEDMPAAYHFLRVRLRFEQARLLRWGEKIGLATELLDQPSRTLQLNRNLILDMLLEVQKLFRGTLRISGTYDRLVPEDTSGVGTVTTTFEDSFRKKILNIFHKAPQVPQRLKWAFIKQDEFKVLVEKLIGYNDSIEGLLEIGAVDHLLYLQHQSYMSILQLNSKVDSLKYISEAMRIQSGSDPSSATATATLDRGRAIGKRMKDNQELADLASFKAQQCLLEEDPGSREAVPSEEISLKPDDEDGFRREGKYRGQAIWIEWKEVDLDSEDLQWNAVITERAKKLVSLLESSQKSTYFQAPACLGYFIDKTSEPQRFGFIYQNPSRSVSLPPRSLLSEIGQRERPSLNQRIALGHTLARSVMYLHSVNWLHKALRSDNILFFYSPEIKRPMLSSPIISGFEFARLDIVDEPTEPLPEFYLNDIYRHPRLLNTMLARSKKSHDIYSLGIILIEIAYWDTISNILHIPSEEKAARKRIKSVKELLLATEQMEYLEGLVGDDYAHAVRTCLKGVTTLDANEDDPHVGVKIQETFSKEVVGMLGNLISH